MRILLQRDDREGCGTALEEATAERCANSFGHERPFVPVRDVSPDTESDPACLARHEGGDEMSTRRNFIKTGGALVVGVTLGDTLLAQAPPAAAARSLDVKQ